MKAALRAVAILAISWPCAAAAGEPYYPTASEDFGAAAAIESCESDFGITNF